LPDSIDGGFVQQRYRAQNANVFDTALTVYNRFEDDNALHLCPHRKRRVLGFDTFNQRRSLQLTANAHGLSRRRSWWRWWWWRRRRHIAKDSTYNAADHPARNPAFNPTRNPFLTAGINVRLLDDLSRGLDWRSPGTCDRHWLDRLRLRRC
jgi:hypothetical protein